MKEHNTRKKLVHDYEKEGEVGFDNNDSSDDGCEMISEENGYGEEYKKCENFESGGNWKFERNNIRL